MSGIFGVDAETDGLYGPVWAVGAVVLDLGGDVAAVFRAQLDPGVVTDAWTREHVVPVVDLPRLASRDNLLEDFWAFWERHGPNAACVDDCGYPVEAGLFRACVERDVAARWNKGPYPLHELASALWAIGVDPDVDRRAYCERPDLVPHDPVDDALATALCWAKVARTRAARAARPVARAPGTGELGTWRPEVIRVVDVLRGLDWTGFDPLELDDLAEVAAAVVPGGPA